MINSEYDTSFRSIKFLYSRTVEILKEDFGLDNIFCPDLAEINLSELDNEECVNVLLLGSFVRSIFEITNWPFKSVRIWVLASPVKKFLVEEFGFDSNDISVIPRDRILEGRKSKELNFEEPVEFVYAGRLNEAKNIESLIYTVHSLQVDHNKDVSLTLIGDSDNQEKVFVEHKSRANFEQILDQLINELEWKVKPRRLPFQEQDKWILGDFKNPSYISLSTNLYEDYGVSVQQALNQNWPVVVSAWGGHLDIRQDHYQVPYPYLTHFRESKYRGKQIASHLLKLEIKKHSSAIQFNKPSEVSIEKLTKLIQIFSLKNGSASFCLFRSEWNNLFLSSEGLNFINRYRSTFRGESPSPSDVLIISDYYNDEENYTVVDRFVEESFKDCSLRQRGLVTYSYIELCSKNAWEDILRAKKVYLGIHDFKTKLASSYNRICEIFDEKDIVVLDGKP